MLHLLRSLLQHMIFSLLLQSTRGRSQVIAPSQPIVAAVGDDIILPCHLEPAVNASDMRLEWARPDLSPGFIHVRANSREHAAHKQPSYRGRTSLSSDGLKHGDVSLKLSTVRVSDEGTYRCLVPSLGGAAYIKLVVAAVSSPVITVMNKASSRVQLQCESAGWYPEPEVLWLDAEGKLLSAGPPETVRGPDDLYTVSSRVTVEKRHSNSFTCRVQQKNTNLSRDAHIHLPAFRGVKALLVLGALGVLLCAFFTVYGWIRSEGRTRRTEQREETETPSHPTGRGSGSRAS